MSLKFMKVGTLVFPGMDDWFHVDAYGNIAVRNRSRSYTALELHRWLQEQAYSSWDDNPSLNITSPDPSIRYTDNIIELTSDYRMNESNMKFITSGSIIQRR